MKAYPHSLFCPHTIQACCEAILFLGLYLQRMLQVSYAKEAETIEFGGLGNISLRKGFTAQAQELEFRYPKST